MSYGQTASSFVSLSGRIYFNMNKNNILFIYICNTRDFDDYFGKPVIVNILMMGDIYERHIIFQFKI